MRYITSLFFTLALLTSQLAAKTIRIGFATDGTVDKEDFEEVMTRQIIGGQVFLSTLGLNHTFALYPLTKINHNMDSYQADYRVLAFAKFLEDQYAEMDFIIICTSLPIQIFNPHLSSLIKRANPNLVTQAAAYYIAGTKVCIMNVRMAPDNTLIHEMTHFLGYKGCAEKDPHHSSDPDSIMSAISFNQWKSDEQTTRLWTEYINSIDPKRLHFYGYPTPK